MVGKEMSDEVIISAAELLKIYEAAVKEANARITELESENERLKAAFRVNMLRAFSNMTHEEIDAEINRVLENKDEN
jgi:uncharacterized small protein (DUF1192 family)